MSLGSDFIGGFSATSSLREQRKDREQRDKLDAAKRQLELDLQAKREAAEKALLNQRLTADAINLNSTQGFSAGESAKDRSFRAGESQQERAARLALQGGDQTFQGTQAQLDRAARQTALDKELKTRADTEALHTALAGAELGMKAREIDARYPSDDTGGFGALPGAQPGMLPITAARPAQPPTAQDQQALIWARANPNDPRAKLILQRLKVTP